MEARQTSTPSSRLQRDSGQSSSKSFRGVGMGGIRPQAARDRQGTGGAQYHPPPHPTPPPRAPTLRSPSPCCLPPPLFSTLGSHQSGWEPGLECLGTGPLFPGPLCFPDVFAAAGSCPKLFKSPDLMSGPGFPPLPFLCLQ